MKTVKKYQYGGKAKKDSVESEMFPGKKIPKSQSNYENGSFARMLEGNKPKKAAKKYETSPFSKAALDKKKREESYKKVTSTMKKKLKAGGKVSKAKGGKEMITRADGTKSRRGLWDNIRAAAKRNKAAGRPGKKPTVAMLKQERKIKAKGK